MSESISGSGLAETDEFLREVREIQDGAEEVRRQGFSYLSVSEDGQPITVVVPPTGQGKAAEGKE